VMLDMALRAENQGLRTDAGSQSFEALRREVVQPRQPVCTGDPDHTAVRNIDEPDAVGQLPLFAERIAVVCGHAGIKIIGGVGGDRPWKV